jgi:hypothetical protein
MGGGCIAERRRVFLSSSSISTAGKIYLRFTLGNSRAGVIFALYIFTLWGSFIHDLALDGRGWLLVAFASSRHIFFFIYKQAYGHYTRAIGTKCSTTNDVILSDVVDVGIHPTPEVGVELPMAQLQSARAVTPHNLRYLLTDVFECFQHPSYNISRSNYLDFIQSSTSHYRERIRSQTCLNAQSHHRHLDYSTPRQPRPWPPKAQRARLLNSTSTGTTCHLRLRLRVLVMGANTTL